VTAAAGSDWSAGAEGDPAGTPFVVFIHGGFWRARYAADTIAPLAQACGRLGLGVWNIEYPRVGLPGGGWPGTARAVAGAVDGAIAQGHGRPVILVGHSAGGHLALWAAHGRSVAGAVSLAGVTDLRAAHAQWLGAGAVRDFVGGEPTEDFYAAASPIERLPLGVPVLLIHAEDDDRVPIEQSVTYASAATAAGDSCELERLPGGDHMEVIDPTGRAWEILSSRLQSWPTG
jgi:acetyl esterase/lipase